MEILLIILGLAIAATLGYFGYNWWKNRTVIIERMTQVIDTDSQKLTNWLNQHTVTKMVGLEPDTGEGSLWKEITTDIWKELTIQQLVFEKYVIYIEKTVTDPLEKCFIKFHSLSDAETFHTILGEKK